MASHARRVLQMAEQLSSEDRASIASALLAGLDYPGRSISTEVAEEAWRREGRRRAERVLRGETEGVAAEDVHAKIERELSKKR